MGSGLCSASQITGVADRSFDLVLCTEMLEHLDDTTYHGALKEFNRIATKAILITVPNRENMRENIACCGNCGQPFHIWGHRRRFTPRDLQIRTDLGCWLFTDGSRLRA